MLERCWIYTRVLSWKNEVAVYQVASSAGVGRGTNVGKMLYFL